jgi:hypothetical protein
MHGARWAKLAHGTLEPNAIFRLGSKLEIKPRVITGFFERWNPWNPGEPEKEMVTARSRQPSRARADP